MSDTKAMYERIRPLIVWLGLTELAWIGYWLLSGDNKTATFIGIAVAWVVAMLAWLSLVVYVASRGFFLKHSRSLSNFVAVALVVTFAVATFGLIPMARQGVLDAVRGTTDLQLISIHVLRLLAIGTMIKFAQGELPLHFVVLGSIPDFLFAVSAVVLLLLSANSSWGHGMLVAWHLIGFFVFFGPGVSMFLSVPSPLRIYHSKPDTSIVFQFPMILAPTYTVPLFMIAHMLALTKLLAT